MENQRLRLRITNMSSLPDGGPLEVSVAPGEILEVGRDSGIGWSLPDPRRFISSRHMELRHDKGGWWLYDISTNGTFVNGGAARVKSPYALQAGDRLQVGHYSVEVRFEAEATGPGAAIGADIGAAIGAGIGAPPERPPVAPVAPPPAPPPRADIWGVAPARPPAPAAPAADIWGTGAPRPAAPPEAAPPPAAQPLPGPASVGTAPPGPAPALPADTPTTRPAAPPVAAARPAGAQPGPEVLLEAIAAAAGLPEGSLSQGNPLETATEIGRALSVLGEELSGLLQARAVARRSVRSGQVTMIGREDNNPLKFMPTPEQALSAMFGPPRPGFQRGSTAIRAAFADIKRHQYATHAAIQPALARLLDDLAPETIEARVKTSGLLSNRRARAWETFVERWDAKAQAHENGMLDVFLTYFAEAYDKESSG
jgi:type VI secretion system FHA domain protein